MALVVTFNLPTMIPVVLFFDESHAPSVLSGFVKKATIS